VEEADWLRERERDACTPDGEEASLKIVHTSIAHRYKTVRREYFCTFVDRVLNLMNRVATTVPAKLLQPNHLPPNFKK